MLFGYFNPLNRTVRTIERAIRTCVSSVATERLWVTHYGAFDIHPRHLVYWVCVRTDAERDRLASDAALMTRLRELLAAHDYPVEGRNEVFIGFESKQTVARESKGNYWHHWK